MGGSWYLWRARAFALITRAWWAVTFPLDWVRTCAVSRTVRVDQACFRDAWSISFKSICGGDIMKENTCFFWRVHMHNA